VALKELNRNANFCKLNDIISLAVGLWAVKAAQKSSTDKYSFGVSTALLRFRLQLTKRSGYAQRF